MAQPANESPGERLARQVKAKGIHDERVLAALSRVPRERFVPPELRPHWAEDRALPIGLRQTISQPFIVALMTQELALAGNERVLEVGTGSGYQTAILSVLAGEVYTIERHALLSLRARSVLDGLHFANIHYLTGDGSLGWPAEAPFDRILVTAATPTLPQPLFEQLAEGGRVVAPLGEEDSQMVTTIEKRAGQPLVREILACRFVPLIETQGNASDSTSE
jgi:protein-L-isoaspartate(D-aspartate) O-methyltransferase